MSKPKTPLEKTRLTQAQIATLCSMLEHHADRCRRVLEDMQKRSIDELECKGAKTFVRGNNYVQGFLANLEEAFQNTLGASELLALIEGEAAEELADVRATAGKRKRSP